MIENKTATVCNEQFSIETNEVLGCNNKRRIGVV